MRHSFPSRSSADLGAAAGLDVVLHHLAARRGAVALAHGAGPDAAGDAADDGVLGVHAVGEEERQVGREVVDLHPARQVVLDDGEAVAQRSEEHTSELQSLMRISYAVFCLKKKKKI